MSRQKGFEAEDLACLYLQENGFEIIKRNFFCKFGEIDIIAFKDKVIHFIEVKSGRGFEPIYALTPAKILKITKTINFFLMRFDPQSDYCIDGLIIKDGAITFIENITA